MISSTSIHQGISQRKNPSSRNNINTSSAFCFSFDHFLNDIITRIDGNQDYQDFCRHIDSDATIVVVVLVIVLIFIPLSYMAALSSGYNGRYLTCFIVYLILSVLIITFLIARLVNKLLVMSFMDRYASIIYSAFFLGITTINGIFLLFRVQSGPCKSAAFQDQWDCNPLVRQNSLPLNNITLNMWMTIAFIALFRCIRWSVHLTAWIISLGFLISATVIVGNANFPVVWISNIAYIVLGGVVFHEIRRQSIYTFKIHKLLEATIDELAELKESEYVEEIRHLITNVAHDLKTVG
jgi:hypothetical protein